MVFWWDCSEVIFLTKRPLTREYPKHTLEFPWVFAWKSMQGSNSWAIFRAKPLSNLGLEGLPQPVPPATIATTLGLGGDMFSNFSFGLGSKSGTTVANSPFDPTDSLNIIELSFYSGLDQEQWCI